jgi:hypothetical protein
MSETKAAATTPPATLEAALARITELEASLVDANSEAAKRRRQVREEREAHSATEKALEKATGELGQVKAKVDAPPDEWKTKHDALQGKLHARDARDEWAKVLGGDSLHEKVTIEKLWSEIGYTPGEALPTPEEITEQVKTARESVSYLFKDPGSTPTPAPGGATKVVKPPLKETVPAGRGAPGTTASRVTVRKSQLGDPKWALDPVNKKTLADASKAGVLDIVDD